jgi:hypothetical protein
MFPDYSTATTAKISERSLSGWMNSGMAFRGEFLTQNTLEHPNDVVGSTLSRVVARSAPAKYFLSPEQIHQWLARALARGISLPGDLSQVLEHQASSLSSTQLSGGRHKRARKQRDSETTGKPTHSIPEEVPMLFARRMLPSEYEKLQGFPENWTATDFEL